MPANLKKNKILPEELSYRFINGYADGYDVAKGGRNPRQLNPPTEESILLGLIEETKKIGQKQIGGGENHDAEVRDTEKDDVLEL